MINSVIISPRNTLKIFRFGASANSGSETTTLISNKETKDKTKNKLWCKYIAKYVNRYVIRAGYGVTRSAQDV